MRAHVIRILRQAQVQLFDCNHHILPIKPVTMIDPAEQQVVGLLTRCALGDRDTLKLGFDLAGDRGCDSTAEFFFQAEQVLQLGIVAFAPDLVTARSFDQLYRDADAIQRFADAALDYVIDLQIPPGNSDKLRMMLSVMPSLKYSCSGSPDRLSNGSTAML